MGPSHSHGSESPTPAPKTATMTRKTHDIYTTRDRKAGTFNNTLQLVEQLAGMMDAVIDAPQEGRLLGPEDKLAFYDALIDHIAVKMSVVAEKPVQLLTHRPHRFENEPTRHDRVNSDTLRALLPEAEFDDTDNLGLEHSSPLKKNDVGTALRAPATKAKKQQKKQFKSAQKVHEDDEEGEESEQRPQRSTRRGVQSRQPEREEDSEEEDDDDDEEEHQVEPPRHSGAKRPPGHSTGGKEWSKELQRVVPSRPAQIHAPTPQSHSGGYYPSQTAPQTPVDTYPTESHEGLGTQDIQRYNEDQPKRPKQTGANIERATREAQSSIKRHFTDEHFESHETELGQCLMTLLHRARRPKNYDFKCSDSVGDAGLTVRKAFEALQVSQATLMVQHALALYHMYLAHTAADKFLKQCKDPQLKSAVVNSMRDLLDRNDPKRKTKDDTLIEYFMAFGNKEKIRFGELKTGYTEIKQMGGILAGLCTEFGHAVFFMIPLPVIEELKKNKHVDTGVKVLYEYLESRRDYMNRFNDFIGADGKRLSDITEHFESQACAISKASVFELKAKKGQKRVAEEAAINELYSKRPRITSGPSHDEDDDGEAEHEEGDDDVE